MSAGEAKPETERASAQEGFLGSLHRLAKTLLAVLHTRLELFTTEVEEEIHRAASILLWAAVALFFGGLFVLMLAVTVLIVFWDEHRVLAASLITATFLLTALVTGLVARARLRAKPRFLAASIEELKRDREALERLRP